MSSVALHEVQLSMGNVPFGATHQDVLVFYFSILVII